MLTISAINDMLEWVGESPIDSTDPDYQQHPLYASAIRILDEVREEVLSRGWWFNKRDVTLTPSGSAITIPASYLTVAIRRMGYTSEYAIRGGALFDMTNGTAVITSPLEATVSELLDFEDLPPTAARYVTETASVRFVKVYDGDPGKLKSVADSAAAAYALFNSDHIRNVKVNVYDTASMSPILANNWYTRYRQR